MGGTISFVDNLPHGTVMTLRIPQSCTPATATAATDDSSTAADSSTATATATASSTELSSEAGGNLLVAAVAEPTAADNEALLRTKRILVSATA
jgi:hypothetical protein